MSMNKMAAAQVLSDAAATIREMAKLAAENRELAGVLADIQQQAQIQKLAEDIVDRGLRGRNELPQLIETLQEKAANGRLEAVIEGLEMVGPDMLPKLAEADGVGGIFNIDGGDYSAAEIRFFSSLTK